METSYVVTHLSIRLSSGYSDFTRELEAALGKVNLLNLQKAAHDPIAIEAAIKSMQGEEGMTLFNIEDLGQLLSLTGPQRTAKRYFVGNFLRASQIVSNEIRLGLYAPLRLLVYETEDKIAYAEFELPSSQFARFENELIAKSGLALDSKMKNLIAIADERAKR